jgi:hypothetical protein
MARHHEAVAWLRRAVRSCWGAYFLLNCAERCGPVHPASPLLFCQRCSCRSVRAALLRPAQVPGSYIASASQVLVSALERRYDRYAVSFGQAAQSCRLPCP